MSQEKELMCILSKKKKPVQQKTTNAHEVRRRLFVLQVPPDLGVMEAAPDLVAVFVILHPLLQSIGVVPRPVLL